MMPIAPASWFVKPRILAPTKVKKIENVVFQAKESKRLTAADCDISSLMVELIASHTLG